MKLKTLGKRIREERLSLNLTQEQLAEDINVSATYIGLIERGERGISLEKLISLADRLGVTVDFLLKDSIQNNESLQVEYMVKLMNQATDEEKELIINLMKVVLNHKSY